MPTFQELLPLYGMVLDAGNRGRWRAGINREPDLPPNATDEVICAVAFEYVDGSAEQTPAPTSRVLTLSLSYFALEHSRYSPHNTSSYQNQVITQCSDWLQLDLAKGEIRYFGA